MSEVFERLHPLESSEIAKPDAPDFGAQTVNVSGKDLLVQSDRVCELALECWNLRREKFATETKERDLTSTVARLKGALKASVQLTGELERRSAHKESDIVALRHVVTGLKKQLAEAEDAKRIYSATLTKMKKTNDGLASIARERDRAIAETEEHKIRFQEETRKMHQDQLRRTAVAKRDRAVQDERAASLEAELQRVTTALRELQTVDRERSELAAKLQSQTAELSSLREEKAALKGALVDKDAEVAAAVARSDATTTALALLRALAAEEGLAIPADLFIASSDAVSPTSQTAPSNAVTPQRGAPRKMTAYSSDEDD